MFDIQPPIDYTVPTMKPKFFLITERSKQSATIMDSTENRHDELLVRGEGETDETWEEFVERAHKRLDYLNQTA